jgi:hypothetical protein
MPRRHPRLAVSQILVWADDHHARTGAWPQQGSGAVLDAPGQTWAAISLALYRGSRGLPGGSSLARLLARTRGYRNRRQLPCLRIEDILRWADAHCARTGYWPRARSGRIPEAPGETWAAINAALAARTRGLTTGGSLARLLALYRGKRNVAALPVLSESQVLAWADAYHDRTGTWPKARSGPVDMDAPGEHWRTINGALRRGLRGLPGGDSLARLLVRYGRLPRLWLRAQA